MDRNEIYVICGRDYHSMTLDLLDRCGLASMIPSKEMLVGIKPNLLGQILASEGGTTHPELAAALIEYLQEKGFRNLVLLEGSWVGDRTSEAVRYCGFDQVCRDYNVPFWDMQEDRGIPRDCAGMELNVCERVGRIEYLINLPVLKGHCQTKMTCALKNMKGLIPNSEKRRFHRLGLHKPIGHLSAGIRQDFILVDNICGDLTFEDGGNPLQQDRLIAALDPVLCDSWCCTLMGIRPREVDYLRIAEEAGVGSCDPAGALVRVFHEKETEGGPVYVRDDRLEAPVGGSDFREVMRLSEAAEAVDSCSACYAYLIPALRQLDREGLLDRLNEKICIGQGYRGETGELGVGNCTRRFRNTAAGCPPTEGQMYEMLRKYILKNKRDS